MQFLCVLNIYDSFGDYFCFGSNAQTLLAQNIIKLNFKTGHAAGKSDQHFFILIVVNNLFVLEKLIIIITYQHLLFGVSTIVSEDEGFTRLLGVGLYKRSGQFTSRITFILGTNSLNELFAYTLFLAVRELTCLREVDPSGNPAQQLLVLLPRLIQFNQDTTQFGVLFI